jgi:alpha-beta hydrolase superfamily lysophospholipase
MHRGSEEPPLEKWSAGGELAAYRVAAANPRAAVLLIHGFATHASRHATKLHRLARAGIDAFAYDLRGHGRSPGRRGLVERFDVLVDDSLTMRARVSAAAPGLPLFVMAESMGGLLAIRGTQRDRGDVHGLVLFAPALGIGDDVPAPLRALARALAEVAPALPFAPLETAALSRTPAIAPSFLADPLTHFGRVPLRTATEMMAAGEAALREAAGWCVPALIVHGDADRIVPLTGSQRFVAAAPAGTIELRVVPGGYHEPTNDPGGDELFETVVAWIEARVHT